MPGGTNGGSRPFAGSCASANVAIARGADDRPARVLAHILDLHSRRVVGWAASDRMKKDLAIRALDMAVRLRQPPEGCLFHSDRGSSQIYADCANLPAILLL
jgi:transposase InsO family protein